MANQKAHEATEVLGLQLKENASALATASSGHNRLYFKTDGYLYWIDDAGTEFKIATLSGGFVPMAMGGLNADVSGFDGFLRIASGTASAIKWNMGTTTAPGVDNDNTQGYAIGSIWLDTTADIAYICLDASTGAAVWLAISDPFRGFAATASANQTVVANTTTLLTWNTETYDVGSWFASNRFTPLMAGYYNVSLFVSRVTGTAAWIEIQKNGTGVVRAETGVSLAPPSLNTTIYLNGSTDYVEAYINTNSTTVTKTTNRAGFSAYLVKRT